MDSNWYEKLFINEAKNALDAINCVCESDGSSGGIDETTIVSQIDAITEEVNSL